MWQNSTIGGKAGIAQLPTPDACAPNVLHTICAVKKNIACAKKQVTRNARVREFVISQLRFAVAEIVHSKHWGIIGRPCGTELTGRQQRPPPVYSTENSEEP
jgi:hypothetical protein